MKPKITYILYRKIRYSNLWFYYYQKEEKPMQLKELKYIVALADEGSISRAAERLYMAQSSLSQFLLQYETELFRCL